MCIYVYNLEYIYIQTCIRVSCNHLDRLSVFLNQETFFFLHIYFDGAGYLVSEITVKIG